MSFYVPSPRNYGVGNPPNREVVIDYKFTKYVCSLSFDTIVVSTQSNDEADKDKSNKPYQEINSLYLNVSYRSLIESGEFSGSISVKVQDLSTVSYEYEDSINKYIVTEVSNSDLTYSTQQEFEDYFEKTVIPLIEKDIDSTEILSSNRSADQSHLTQSRQLLSSLVVTSRQTNIGSTT